MNSEHPDLDPNDPRWATAEFGAKIQDLIDTLTPDGYGRFVVDGWMLVAETIASDGVRHVTTIPFDRYEVPKLVGIMRIASKVIESTGTGLSNG